MNIDIKIPLKRQHHASMAMLKEAITNASEELWLGGEHPRNYWRIAYHAAGYAHLYLYENLETWRPWSKARKECSWLNGDDVPIMQPYSQEEMVEFVELIESEIDQRIDALDLEEPTCGFVWYPTVSRFELLLLSLRHLHGHIGQLTELLIAEGKDVKWQGPPPADK